MSTPSNPYIIDAPVTGQEFFGREAFIQAIIDVLRYPNHTSVIVYGQRKMGKSSLLRQLVETMGAPFFPIYFNLEGKALEPLPQVLHQMAMAAVTRAGMAPPPVDDFQNNPDAFHKSFLPELHKALSYRQQPTFLLDEFNPIDTPENELPPDAAGRKLDSYLYTLLTTQSHTDFIFAAGRRMNELSSVERSGYRADLSQYLTVLNPDQTKKLINKVGAPPYEADALPRILDVTRGHPYLVQLLCHTIYEQAADKSQPVSGAQVKAAVNALAVNKATDLPLIWDSIPLAEQVVLAAAAEQIPTPGAAVSQTVLDNAYMQANISPTSSGLRQASENLVNWQVFEQSAGGYTFFVDYFRRWVKQNRSLEQVRATAIALDPKINLLFIEAQNAYNAGQLDTAIKKAEQVLALNPDHVRAHMLIGQIHKEQRRPGQAVKAYESAFKLNRAAATGGWVAAMLMLARQQEGRHDTDAARATYRRLLAVDPGNDEAESRLTAMDKAEATLKLMAQAETLPSRLEPVVTQPSTVDPGETLLVTPTPAELAARRQARIKKIRRRQGIFATIALLLLVLLCVAIYFLFPRGLWSGRTGDTVGGGAAIQTQAAATAPADEATAAAGSETQGNPAATEGDSPTATTAAVENATVQADEATAETVTAEAATADAITSRSATVQAATAEAILAETATAQAEAAIATVEAATATAEARVAGVVDISGSAAILPLFEELASRYTAVNPAVEINISPGSSADGLSALQRGEVALALVSRPVTARELEALGDVQLFSLPQADPVAIVTHPQLPVSGLTSDQVRDIFSGEITNWREVGGPDAPITLVLPAEGVDSRTVFESALLGPGVSLAEGKTISATTGITQTQVQMITTTNDAAIREIVSRQPNAIGFTAVPPDSPAAILAQTNLQKQNWAVIDSSLLAAKTLLLDDAAPTSSGAQDGSYPLSRPFNIVAPKELSPVAQAWIDFLYSPEGQRLIEQTRQDLP
jgi:ABC-type phosphate transport system substrate-binding protein/tetratricopeptide (TPR) repeat protein